MAIKMIMPKVDMDQETGTVVEWLKGNGQQVEEGETILVIETDKIAIDVEAPGTGILDGISAHTGDVIPIGTVIAYILGEGEELPETPVAKIKGIEISAPSSEGQPGTIDIPATPIARNLAAAEGVDLSALQPTGKGGKVTKADVEEFLSQVIKSAAPGEIIATPAARKTARLQGINLGLVRGSGPGGRIQVDDVEKYQLQAGIQDKSPIPDGERVPLIGMRRTIAERVSASYQSIPHIQFSARADMTKFTKTRDDYNELALKRGDEKLSVTALLVKLVAMVLADNPWLNSSLVDDTIILHKNINIGVAVALEKGLIVPVIKNADQKGISQITAEASDLIGRARAGTLSTEEVKGSTFTISNLGPFGVEQFNAIINPPEAGMLAVGSITPEVVPLPDGVIAVRPLMRFTLSADHRIVDGAVAARFISDLKTTLENPRLKD